MNILMVDDEENTMIDHRIVLREIGHQVEQITQIDSALIALKRSFLGEREHPPYGLVLIDLMMPGQRIPQELAPYSHGNIAEQGNEGQALGQWLWEYAGAHKIHERPIHCYFTNISNNYCLHKDPTRQEFKGSVPESKLDVQAFILEKTCVLPSELMNEIARIQRLWDALRCSKLK